MSTRLVTFNAQNVTPQDDALLYEKAVPGAGIIYGCDLSHAGSNTIHISTGFGIVDGRFFEVVEDTITVPLSSSGTIQGRVIARLDLSNTGDPFVIIAQTAPLSPLRVDSDVNIFNGTHEFLLASFEIDELTIKNFQDVKPGVGIDLSGYAPIASPTFTGTPTTPNIADLTTQTSQIANAKFVQEVLAAKMNTATSDGLVLKGGENPSRFWGTNTAGVPSWQPIPYQGESDSDTFNVASGATVARTAFASNPNNSRRYWGASIVQFGGNATGRRLAQVVRKNADGTEANMGYFQVPATASGQTVVTVPFVSTVVTGGSLYVRVYQNSGASISVTVRTRYFYTIIGA